MTTSKKESNQVTTPEFRVSFPRVFEAEAFEDGADPEFSIAMIFAADADLKPMKILAGKVAKAKFGEDLPKKLKSPFHSGEDKDLEGYDDDTTYATARCKKRPGIVGPDGVTRLLTESELYAGCYARATLVPYAYDNKSKGVAFGLRNLQFIRHGEPFSGAVAPEDDFEAIEGHEPAESEGDDDGSDLF